MAMSGQVRTYEVDDGTYFYVNWSANTRTNDNINGNYDDISWTVNIHCRYRYDGDNSLQSYGMAIDNVDVYGGGLVGDKQPGDYELASGTTRIYHDNDGTKTINIRTSGWVFEGGVTSGSGDFTLDPINRYAITNSVTGSDIEGNFSVNYTKYLSTYKYKLRISVPNIVLLERINYDTNNETFTLSQATIESLYQRFTNTNTFDLGFAVETWSSDGNTKLSDGNEKIITAKITGATPVFEDFDFNDINTTTLALTGNSKYNVNGYSTIRATISTVNKAVAQKGATMVKYRFIIGETTQEEPYSSNSTVNIDIPNSSIGEYKVYAIDSRGNSTLVTKVSEKNIDYQSVYLNPNSSYVERDDGGIGENVTLHLSGTIWNNTFGAETNSITLVKYEFKKTNEDDTHWVTGPTTITPTISDDRISFNGQIGGDGVGYTFDIQKSYNFRITVADELSTFTIDLVPLSSGTPNISLNREGVGIMCDYNTTLGGLLQVGGKIIDGGKVIWTNTSPTSSFAAQTINLDESLSNYDMYEIIFKLATNMNRVLSTGQIPVGKGTILNYITKNPKYRFTEEYVSGDSIAFEDCNSLNAIGSSTIENTSIVPLYVIAYKTGLIS